MQAVQQLQLEAIPVPVNKTENFLAVTNLVFIFVHQFSRLYRVDVNHQHQPDLLSDKTFRYARFIQLQVCFSCGGILLLSRSFLLLLIFIPLVIRLVVSDYSNSRSILSMIFFACATAVFMLA